MVRILCDGERVRIEIFFFTNYALLAGGLAGKPPAKSMFLVLTMSCYSDCAPFEVK